MGLVAVLCGAAAGSVEMMLSGHWPGATDAGYAAFLIENRTLIVAQSVLFVLNAAALIWFLGYVRAQLVRAEGEPGTVSGIAFGAGLVSFGMLMVGQAAQATLTLPSQVAISSAIAGAVQDLCLVTLTLANIPAAVILMRPRRAIR